MNIQLKIFKVQDEFTEDSGIRYIACVVFNDASQPGLAELDTEHWITSNSIFEMSAKLPFLGVTDWPGIELILLRKGGYSRTYSGKTYSDFASFMKILKRE